MSFRRSRVGRAWARLVALLALALTVLPQAACPSPPSPHEGHVDDVSAAGGGARAPGPGGAGGGAPPAAPGARAPRKIDEAPAPAARGASTADAGQPAVDLVTIRVLVDPPQVAHVVWGAKDLGLGPLDIRRPRGSGPLDLVLRAPGFLTLHTRAFTDRDNTLGVRLVPDDEAARFPGYQAPAPSVRSKGKASGGASRPPGRPRPSAAPRAPHGDAASDGAGAP